MMRLKRKAPILNNDAPIIQLVDCVLEKAVLAGASDIHFEPYPEAFCIRYRVDGYLQEMDSPPLQLSDSVISRIKVISNLNIAERRIPQDGRIKLSICDRMVDLRVSILPTQFGESVVIRLLDKAAIPLQLDQLGMPQSILAGVRQCIHQANGIFLTTGPTGSGKTTTLYSALNQLNQNEVKILSVEDPVEYSIDGIMQVSVHPEAGLSFATTLRSFLRQDPDHIMIGEIRDLETAQVAAQASLTGHLVLSTLHTNDAPGAVTRLIDMGLEPYLVAASLEGVLAQRLVRSLCIHCKSPYTPDPILLKTLNLNDQECARFYRAKGCPACQQTGYAKRFGLFELLIPNEEFKKLICTKTPNYLLKQHAIENKMHTLRDSAIDALFQGKTSLEEVFRYLMPSQ